LLHVKNAEKPVEFSFLVEKVATRLNKQATINVHNMW